MKIVILEIPHQQELNQLIQNMHFDAYCFSRGAIFINPKFYDLSITLNNLKISIIFKIIGWILHIELVRKVLIKTKIAKYYKFHAPDMKNEFEIGFLTYVKGWYFRNGESVDNVKSFYIEKFNKTLRKEIEYEKKKEFFIGVHIRRGDYINFQGGKYYLTDDQYITALKNVIKDIEVKFRVVLFGNDPELNVSKYIGLGLNLTVSKGTIYEDYYRLSKCDIVLGPSSTFTIWSQFISYGKMKKIILDCQNYQNVRLKDAI
jgi:hypothetical protein